MSTRDLILKYWRSWQEPSDFDEMQSCLADDVKLDFGGNVIDGAASVRQMVEASADPWKDVELIDSIFTDSAGAIIYEGTSIENGTRFRVGEILHVEGDRIARATAVFAPVQS